MNRLLNVFSSVVFTFVLGFTFQATSAQTYLNTVGNPSFGVNIPVPNGYINIANGNLHLEIPLTTSKQRGALNLNERLVYDSRIWEIVQYNNYYWWPLNVPNSQVGWRLVRGNETGTLGSIVGSIQNTSCWTGDYNQPYTISTTYYNWTDPSGTLHPFNANSTSYTVPSNCPGNTPGTVTNGQSGYAADASGYYATVTSGPYGNVNVTIKDSSGTQVYPQVIDRFGNYWSSDTNGNLIDDLGRTPVIVTANGNVTYYDVLAPNGPISNNGTRVRYTVTTEQLTLTTNFNQSGVTEYQNNGNPPGSDAPTVPAIQSIQLPDGTQYQFTYDSYGEVQTETLPTGGSITYGWSNYTDSYQNVNRWITSSTINSATTTYTPSVVSQCSSNGTGCQESVNVHRPSGDETVYTLTLDNGAWDTNSIIYQGAASNNQPKESSVTTYNFSQACSIPGCNGAQNVTKSSEVDTLLDTNMSTQIQTSYAQPVTGQLTTWSQWDYYPAGSTPSSTPTRQIQYGYTNYDLTQETHYDQNGNVASTTQYNYTSNATATSGIVSHGSVNSGGPYLTSVSRTNNSPATTLTATSTYDDTGSLQTSQDFNQNPVTTYKYDPTDTFVVETDRPTTGGSQGTFSHVSKASYDPNSGALSTTDDENSVANGQAYTVHYAYEGTAGRLSSITYPDGGGATYTYPSSTEVDTTVAQNSSASITTASVSDAYGRPYKVSSGGYSSETTYDGNGRVYSVTNPHQSSTSSTDGYNYTFYDTLDRVTSVVLPDNNSRSVTYNGNSLTATDELGNQKSETFDAFGKITSVTEADPVTGALDLQTAYQRDGLGNITCIEQHGNVSGTGCSSSQSSDSSSPWRVRRFYYNSLSQLRAVEIPEHMYLPSNPPSQNCGTPDNASQWTDCYTYDSNGNRVSSKDNTAITNTYTYDALNRLTSEGSANLLKLYTYDGGTNGVGHTWTQSNEALSASQDQGPTAKSLYAYDQMGRVTSESACRPDTCGAATPVYQTVSVAYDLSGNPTSVTYPDGRVVQNIYDLQNRLSAVNYQQWGGQAVGTTYWSAPSYAPPGELTAATYGNGMQLQATFNSRQSITSLSYQANSATVFGKTYQWAENAANLLQETNVASGQQRQFGYDRLNRLISAVDASGSASSSTGTATVSGTEGHQTICSDGDEAVSKQAAAQPQSIYRPPPPPTCTTTYDSGTISLTVNGFTVSTPYSRYSTATSLATALTSLLNENGSPVTATSSGAVITLTSIAQGTSADYSMSETSSSDFSIALSGSAMTGGQNSSPTPGGLNQQYTLDAWGNLSDMGGSSGFSQSINNQNQVGVYLYDAAGRMLSDKVRSYTYDSNGMLATSSDGASYVYDGGEQRASVTLNGSETDYYYFGGRLYAIANAGNWTDLLYAGGTRIGEVAGNQTATPTYDVLDHIGSEVATVNNTGAVISSMDYTPFGQLFSGSNSDGYVFAGLLRDNDGLDHADFRQYSYVTGRWSTPDPYDGSYSFNNPQSLNRYGYVGNMPLWGIDHSGFQCTQSASADYSNGQLANLVFGAVTCDGGGFWGAVGAAIIDGLEYLIGHHSTFRGNVAASNGTRITRTPPSGGFGNPFGDALFTPQVGGAYFGGAYNVVQDATIATTLAYGGAFTLGTSGILADAAGGLLPEEEAISVVPDGLGDNIAYGDHLFASETGNTYHIAARFMTQDVLENGNLIKFGSDAGFSTPYQLYSLPGEVTTSGAVNGTFEIGGHLLSCGTFYVTHACFIP